MKHKRFLALALAGVVAFVLCACSGGSTVGNGTSGDPLTKGLKDTVETLFFDFSVESAQWVEEVEGYTAAEGNALLDTVIKIKNTSNDGELPMSTYDFQAQWGGAGDDDYAYQPEELTGEGIMPVEFTLGKGETAEYHVVYEVPAGSTDLSVSYWELYTDSDGNEVEGDTYFVYFTLS